MSSTNSWIVFQWSDNGFLTRQNILDEICQDLMSIHFLLRRRIEMDDSATASFSRGFALVTGFFVTLCSAFSRELVSDVSVTFLLIPFTIRNKKLLRLETESRSRFQYRNLFLMKTDLHIHHWADFPVSVNHPLARDASSLRGNGYSRHKILLKSYHCFTIFVYIKFSLEIWNLWICYFTVDTELICSNERAQNQFNRFFTTVEVKRLLSLIFSS